MPDHSRPINEPSSYWFGYDVMGPILAECCFLLHEYLKEIEGLEKSCVLFCARGGLVIKRAMELYLGSTSQVIPAKSYDFMVSRLTASRLALEMNPDQIAPYLAIEFKGRSCAEVATVLSGKFISDTGEWARHYDIDHLLHLMSSSQQGLNLKKNMIRQAELLRGHFADLVQEKKFIYIVDTGVFGSIGHFLRLGLPGFTINSVLLFRANYKNNINMLFPESTGLICSADKYYPWNSRSVSRLYWPFIESFFEPSLPSVRIYKQDSSGNILSNLQIHNWQEQLRPPPSSIRAGAYDYLAGLKLSSVPEVSKAATHAWKHLHKHIIYPGLEDLDLLKVTQRGLDFGFDEIVSFADKSPPNSLLKRLTLVRESVWPEGEVRRLFKLTGGFWLKVMELHRFVAAITQSCKNKLKIP